MIKTTIAKGHWLAAAPAASYKRMRAAGCPAGITDAGRTYAEQAELYRRYLAGQLVATAARPGTSKHEKGNALDLPEPARAWVREHGAAYGWIKDRVSREKWHMEYDPSRDIFATPWTVTAYVLNGRVGPFKAIRVRRRKGFKVYGVRIVNGWLVTRFGTYYSLNFLEK
jgi:hypothetical protein